MSGIKLFCLPYAGGSASIYTRWERCLDSTIKLRPVELAGRSGRINEPYYNSMNEAVEDIAGLIEKELGESDYAIFGHSMGSVIAYELIRRFSMKNFKLPVHVFFSGRYPPNIKRGGRVKHSLPETEFQHEAMKLGGINENLLRFSGLLKSALDTLRADYKVLETYDCECEIHKWNFDISVLAGKDDVLAAPSDMEEWKKYTRKQCKFYYFDGGHFYLHNHVKSIVQIINNTLTVVE